MSGVNFQKAPRSRQRLATAAYLATAAGCSYLVAHSMWLAPDAPDPLPWVLTAGAAFALTLVVTHVAILLGTRASRVGPRLAHVAIYLLLLGCLATFMLGTFPQVPETSTNPPSTIDIATVPLVVLILGTQTILLLGVGTISLRPDRPSRIGFYLLLAGIAGQVVLLGFGLVAALETALDLSQLSQPRNLLHDWFGRTLLAWLGASWLLWFALALVWSRKAQSRALSQRLVKGLIVGSWVEFAIALPIHLVARARAEDKCSCSIGSWIALLTCIPIMALSFGPALLLFYREGFRRGAIRATWAWRVVRKRICRRPARNGGQDVA